VTGLSRQGSLHSGTFYEGRKRRSFHSFLSLSLCRLGRFGAWPHSGPSLCLLYPRKGTSAACVECPPWEKRLLALLCLHGGKTESEPLKSPPAMGNETSSPKLIIEPSLGVAGEPAPIGLSLRGKGNDAIVIFWPRGRDTYSARLQQPSRSHLGSARGAPSCTTSDLAHACVSGRDCDAAVSRNATAVFEPRRAVVTCR
jgi:hypothetical protein